MAGPKKSSPSFARYTAMDSGAISTSLPFITNFLSTYCKLALPRPITDAVDSGEVSRQQQVAPHVWAHLLEILAQAKEDWNLLELLLSEVELHRHLMTFVISFSEVAIPRDVLKFMAKVVSHLFVEPASMIIALFLVLSNVKCTQSCMLNPHGLARWTLCQRCGLWSYIISNGTNRRRRVPALDTITSIPYHRHPRMGPMLHHQQSFQGSKSPFSNGEP